MLLIPILVLACTPGAVSPEAVATDKAVEFTTLALVERDFAAAHRMLSAEERKQTSLDEFEAALRSQHPSGYPARVTPDGTRPVPKYDGIAVYLVGDHGSGSWYYVVGKKRQPSGSYTPTGLTRSEIPFPRPKAGIEAPSWRAGEQRDVADKRRL